jgi:hypothetical protein
MLQVAAMYAANRLWQEALDGYTALLKNKQQPQGARCVLGAALRAEAQKHHYQCWGRFDLLWF